jgi:NarL family two-component system response regulator LiaR
MSEREPIRVVIVDDHDMVRSGLAVFLESCEDLELVGEAANGVEAVRLCAKVQPHVVLMDLVMPEMDGIAATEAIRQADPRIQVIALTSFAEDELVERALRAGAIGYLLKNIAIDDLANAIRAAARGKPTLAPEAFRSLMEIAGRPTLPEYDLTEREMQVLQLLVEGLSNTQIAERLVVSRATVKTHVSNLLSKLGVANRVEAASFALQHNLVPQSRGRPPT